MNRALSEGRKAFAERLAGIESGAECDRLAPQLSALADGEARAEDMAVLRPHLRTCLVCRARLRDYRAAPPRVAAFAPPVAASGLIASARDLLTGAGGWISERAAALAARWHQAAELAGGNKMAAVVASTAALAGSGASTVATIDGEDPPTPVQPIPESSVAPSAPPTPRGNERAERRHDTASSGATTGHDGPRGERAAADRDPAPAARRAGESSALAPPAGEFTPRSRVRRARRSHTRAARRHSRRAAGGRRVRTVGRQTER